MFSGFLRQSTAVTVPIGPFSDATDGFTDEVGLTLTQADHRLSKNGGAFAQKNEASSSSHAENGHYLCALDATDTDTLGRLAMRVIDTGARPVYHEFMVVPANVWDSMFGSDKLQVDAQEWLGAVIATPTVAGVPEVDVTHWLGTTPATPTVAGVPEVDVTHLGGSSTSASDLKDFADDGYDPTTNLVNATATIGGLSAQAKADVNAEVLDVLNVDTFAQPGQGDPPATTTFRLMVAYLYKWARNRRTQTSSQESFYNDDASTIDHKRTVADDGTTASKGEIVTGP